MVFGPIWIAGDMMLFCPKCGSILKPGKKKGSLECSSCKTKVQSDKESRVSEHLTKKSKKVEIVEEEPEILPLCEEKCPKCGHEKAYYYLQQTRAGDEPETKFLKCEKCSYKWRDYS